MAKNNVELNKDSYLKLMETYLNNAQEERDLALDRYRRQDDQINTPEDFVLQGKNASAFLSLAANRTESIFNAMKEMKAIIFSKDEKDTSGVAIGDDLRRQIAQEIRKIDEESQSDS